MKRMKPEHAWTTLDAELELPDGRLGQVIWDADAESYGWSLWDPSRCVEVACGHAKRFDTAKRAVEKALTGRKA